MSDVTQDMMVAVGAVRLAAEICTAVQQSLITSDTLAKKDRSPVTVADYASQAVVCRLLEQAYPDVPMVAEEGSTALRDDTQVETRQRVVDAVRTALPNAGETEVLDWIDRGDHAGGNERFWTLDPIDGTKGFLRREHYAVALALVEEGQVQLAALACPSMNMPGQITSGAVLLAAKGHGSFILPLRGCGLVGREPITTDGLTHTAQAKFCESVESGHSDQDQSVQIAKKLGITAKPVRMDSQAKYAAVARGMASIYLRLPTSETYREKIWDHAAGKLVVEEAGGKVTDVHGQSLDFTHGRKLEQNQGIIATNGPLHDRVVQVVAEVLGNNA